MYSLLSALIGFSTITPILYFFRKIQSTYGYIALIFLSIFISTEIACYGPVVAANLDLASQIPYKISGEEVVHYIADLWSLYFLYLCFRSRKTGKPVRPWFWPKIRDVESATRAINIQFWLLLSMGVLGACITAISKVYKNSSPIPDISSYYDAAAYVVIAWRVKRGSLFFSALGISLFIAEKHSLLYSPYPISSGIGYILLVLLVVLHANGVRGSYWFFRNKAKINIENSSNFV